MRNAIRILIVAVAASLALAASAATADAAHPIHDVAVTGTTDNQTPFSGTITFAQFSAAPGGGIQVEIAGLDGIEGVLVADKQEVGIQNVAVLTDQKLSTVVLVFEFVSPIETTSGGTVSLDPINLTESELAPGANGILLALDELLSQQASEVVGPPCDPVAALLNVGFGLWPSKVS